VLVLEAAFDPVFEAAGLLAADFVAVDFETDFLAVPVFSAAACGAAFALVAAAVAVFFFGAGACWADAAAASVSAAIDTARNRNVPLPF